jgi:hypothetical protein
MPRALLPMTVDEVRMRAGDVARPVRKVAVADLPESWRQEGPAATTQIAVGICIPFGGFPRWTPPEFAIALAMLQLPPSTQVMYLSTKGVKRDEARNDLVRQALSAGSRNVLFLDDDNPPPPDALMRLLQVLESSDDDVGVVAGVYVSKQEPSVPLVFQSDDAGPYWRWRVGDVFECHGIATGCMMVKAEVFRRIPEPWFRDIVTLEDAHAEGWFLDRVLGQPAEVTDDLYFCRKARQAGYRILAHGGVLPGHWGQDGKCYRLAADAYPFRGRVDG